MLHGGTNDFGPDRFSGRASATSRRTDRHGAFITIVGRAERAENPTRVERAWVALPGSGTRFRRRRIVVSTVLEIYAQFGGATTEARAVAILEDPEHRRRTPHPLRGYVSLDELDSISADPPPEGPPGSAAQRKRDSWLREKARRVDRLLVFQPKFPEDQRWSIGRIQVAVADDGNLTLVPWKFTGADLAAAREVDITHVDVRLHYPKVINAVERLKLVNKYWGDWWRHV